MYLSRNLAAILFLIWDGISKIIDIICKVCSQVILNTWIPGSVGAICECTMPCIFLQCKKVISKYTCKGNLDRSRQTWVQVGFTLQKQDYFHLRKSSTSKCRRKYLEHGKKTSLISMEFLATFLLHQLLKHYSTLTPHNFFSQIFLQLMTFLGKIISLSDVLRY